MKANNVITKSEQSLKPAPVPVRDEMSQALAPAPEHLSLGALSVGEEGVIAKASEIATELSKVIEAQKLYVSLKGKKYILIEGWTTLLAILGCGVREVSCKKGPHQEWIAEVEIFKLSDGHAIGSASAMVERDEMIIKKTGERVQRWTEGHQRRSMAITRATSKACRMSFAWITALSGYAATPADEMPQQALEKQVTKEVTLAPDPLVSQALLREAVHICATKKSVDALEGWFQNLSRYGKECLKVPEILAEMKALKESLVRDDLDRLNTAEKAA